MADDKHASEYNIEGGSVLHLVLALRGGLCPHDRRCVRHGRLRARVRVVVLRRRYGC